VLASALDHPLYRLAGGESGAALGAARLGRLAATGEAPEKVCTPPKRAGMIEPDPALRDAYAARIERFRTLYRAIRPATA
jgi:xylulokinase